jgi:tRNA 2-selenouridine synthase SelU
MNQPAVIQNYEERVANYERELADYTALTAEYEQKLAQEPQNANLQRQYDDLVQRKKRLEDEYRSLLATRGVLA